MSFPDVSDAELVRAVLEGRKERFNELVDRHFPMVYAIAYGGVGNHADAEDLTQETFAQAYRAPGQRDSHAVSRRGRPQRSVVGRRAAALNGR